MGWGRMPATLPPLPPTEVPLAMESAPELPAVEVPVARVIAPLTPLVPASAVDMLTRPLEVAEPTLTAGRTLVALSATQVLESQEALLALASGSGGRIIVPSGALCGLDAVRAAAEGGRPGGGSEGGGLSGMHTCESIDVSRYS